MRFKKLLFSLLASLLSVTFFVSCDDSSSDFGLDVLPSEEMIQVKINDTIQVTYDQIIFNEERLPRTDYITLGILKDSVLGEINASLYSQFNPRYVLSDSLNNSSRVSLVSLILHLQPNTNYIGGADDKVVIDVYPLVKALSITQNYNYNFPGSDYIDKTKAPLATFEINASKIKNGFDVELPKEYANKFLQYNNANLNKIESLMSGLCFLPRSHSGIGLMASFDFAYIYGSNGLQSVPASYMSLKVEIKKDSIFSNTKWIVNDTIITDSVVFDFTSTRYNDKEGKVAFSYAKANPFKYGYSSSIAKTSLNGNLSDSCMYISNKGGAKIRYNLSKLDSFPVIKNSKISKAELIIPFEKNYFVKNNVNKQQLSVILVDPDTTLYWNYEDLKYYNVSRDKSGNAITSTIDTINYSYKVDVTNFVEKYVSLKYPIKDIIITMNSSSILDKAVLKKNKKPTLKIKYTIF